MVHVGTWIVYLIIHGTYMKKKNEEINHTYNLEMCKQSQSTTILFNSGDGDSFNFDMNKPLFNSVGGVYGTPYI
jgi:hypothetical protein